MAGRTTANGYGASHQDIRRVWKPKVDRGGVPCARCGLEIPPAGDGICPAVLASGQRCLKNHKGWDLGHLDGDRRHYRGPEHACCNRGAPGKRRKKAGDESDHRFSRVW